MCLGFSCCFVCFLRRWSSETPGNKGRPVGNVMYLERVRPALTLSAPDSGVTVIPVQTSRDLCKLFEGMC
jgi:hypothetical protein